MIKQRKIIHIDMDCFYAAIEMRDFPDLANKPIAVGGNANNRGVISTCNYTARKYGIRSAMATAYAFKLCPNLVLQPVRMDVYRKESKKIREIFKNFTDEIEPLSLDEAYLDVTNCTQHHGSATWIAQSIRKEIFKACKLTASAGIAPNKILAKIASDWNKPNGQKVIKPEEVEKFMLILSVRKLPGVGPKTENKLHALGVKTCEDLQKHTIYELSEQFGIMGKRLYELARGIDNRPVNPVHIRKSISVEETFPQDLTSIQECLDVIPMLLAKLNSRIIKAKNIGEIHNIFVKVKFSDFQQTTVEKIANKIDSLIIHDLLKQAISRKNLPIRLLGVGIKLKYQNSNQLAFI